MRRAISRMKIRPNKVQTDQGKEFLNEPFKALMDEYGAIHYFVDSETKSPVTERLNRTLREKYQIIKMMEPRLKPPQILKRAVSQYNNTPHTSLRGATPEQQVVVYFLQGVLHDISRNVHPIQTMAIVV